MPPLPIRIAIVTDNVVVSEGFVSVLAFHLADLEVDVELVPAGREESAEVVLYDVSGLHNADGGDLRQLAKRPDAVVVALQLDARPDLTARALELGAVGFVSMSAGAEEIVRVLKEAVAGTLGHDGTHTAGDLELGDLAGLTDRETAVLQLVALGRSNAEIAAELYVTINTVKTYIRLAYRKIGVRTRAQAVGWALQRGFQPPLAPDPDD